MAEIDTFWPFQFVRAAFRFYSFNWTHPVLLSLSSSGFLKSYFFFVAYCTTPCCYNLHLPQCIFRCLGFVNNSCIFLLSVLCVHQWLTIFVKAVTHMPDIHFIFSFIRGDRVQEINCSKPFQANNPSEGCVSCLVLGRRIFIATSISPSKASFGQATFRIVETDDTHTKNKAFITFISTLGS